jgi:hypothetical protein
MKRWDLELTLLRLSRPVEFCDSHSKTIWDILDDDGWGKGLGGDCPTLPPSTFGAHLDRSVIDHSSDDMIHALKGSAGRSYSSTIASSAIAHWRPISMAYSGRRRRRSHTYRAGHPLLVLRFVTGDKNG